MDTFSHFHWFGAHCADLSLIWSPMKCHRIHAEWCVCLSCVHLSGTLAAVICVWQEIVSIIKACESYLAPLCTYITGECCLQTTLTRLVCPVNGIISRVCVWWTHWLLFVLVFVGVTKQCLVALVIKYPRGGFVRPLSLSKNNVVVLDLFAGPVRLQLCCLQHCRFIK